MFTKDNVKPADKLEKKKLVEADVVKALQITDYSLNTVNSYGNNLLHVSTANGCFEIIKEILQNKDACQAINRKNKFGWTPLMVAIRNRDDTIVQLLLEKNASINESTYFGMSVIGLAATTNQNMFETVFKVCPSALLNSANDDITPLCIAAMKNDRDLFFKLMDLGMGVSNANEYTQIMMRQSRVPEIVNLLEKRLEIEDYWNDVSTNFDVEINVNAKKQVDFTKSVSESKIRNNSLIVPKCEDECNKQDKSSAGNFSTNSPSKVIFVFEPVDPKEDCETNDLRKKPKTYTTNLLTGYVKSMQESISPAIICNLDKLVTSPDIYSIQKDCDYESPEIKTRDNGNTLSNFNEVEVQDFKSHGHFIDTAPILQRLQSIRPLDLDLRSNQDDSNLSLGYMPEFTPIRSPCVPLDISTENMFGAKTPTPPHYRTPPRGVIFNSDKITMFILLNHYGLSHHVPKFLEEEVDFDLFMTLTDQDLIEIGIESKSDRKALLDVIMDYKRSIHCDII